jgi:hypothetical protein
LAQTGGVINPVSDIAVQTASPTTTPARTIQWYTSHSSGVLFVRVSGTPATTADYNLDYDVQFVPEIVHPPLVQDDVEISTLGQTTNTDLWVYDPNRNAWPTAGNDDDLPPPGGTQSFLVRNYGGGLLFQYLAISDFNLANHRPSPADDNNRDGNVLDLPGIIVNSSEAANVVLNPTIESALVPATKAGFFDVVFIRFQLLLPVELMDFRVE